MSTLNVQQAADMMKVHPQTVLDLIAAGAIPAAQIGRSYVMLEKDVLAYIEKQIVQQTAERMGLSKSPERRSRRQRRIPAPLPAY